MRDINELLNAGTMAQIEKLKENEHKPGFRGEVVDTFFRLYDEVIELGEEIFDNFGVVEIMKIKENPDYSKIRREGADCANFSHMIILDCDDKLGSVFNKREV